jgi:hypothetical protein
MTPHVLGAVGRVDETLRCVRALGAHRYVAGRLHLLHALALSAVPDDAAGALVEARAWAARTLATPGIDPSSRAEALWRRGTDAELVAVLDAFWTPGSRADAARDALLDQLERQDLRLGHHEPFDENAEDDIHPLLVDAGWELLPLAGLDPTRHAGAIAAFESPLAFESACFEEQTAIPPRPTLYELPAIGPIELLRGAGPEGELAEPLVVWAEGHPVYLDYVLRGVRRAAKV